MQSKTFIEYEENKFAKDYCWCDDNMPDAFDEWLANRDEEDLVSDFEEAISNEILDIHEYNKYKQFIISLIQ